jgi:hypothetical protein
MAALTCIRSEKKSLETQEMNLNMGYSRFHRHVGNHLYAICTVSELRRLPAVDRSLMAFIQRSMLCIYVGES